MLVEYLPKHFWDILSFIVVAAGVVAAFWELRKYEKIRRSDLLMRLFDMWDSLALVEARKFIHSGNISVDQKLKKYNRDQKEYYLLHKVPNFFEHVGVLTKKKGIFKSRFLDPKKEIKDLMKSSIQYYWEKFEGYVKKEQDTRETAYENFEKLAKEMEEIENE